MARSILSELRESPTDTISFTHTARVGLALITLGVIVDVVLSLAGVRSGIVVPPSLKEGVSAFAVAYLQAQFIERIIEPFSEADLNPKGSPHQKLFGDTVEIKRLTQLEKIPEHQLEQMAQDEIRVIKEEPIKKTTNQFTGIAQAVKDDPSTIAKAKDKLSSKRTIAIWGLASLLGMLLCYFTVGLFEVVGITFNGISIYSAAITGHTVDSILSGVIVGSGTKPLHDVISYIEKQQKSS